MENMLTYNGTWTIPGNSDWDSQQFSGTLSFYGDKETVLELIHEPNTGAKRINHYYDVIWGTDARMQRYTLFNATFINNNDSTSFLFTIQYVLIGAHVKSIEDKCFKTCIVKYPFLNRWALDSRISGESQHNKTHFILDFGKRTPFFSVKIEDNLEVTLFGQLTNNYTRYSIEANQITNLIINSTANISISSFIKSIAEFTQFLSIALFSEQHPAEAYFFDSETNMRYPLLFKKRASVEPFVLSLIKFDSLKDRLPSLYINWHNNFNQIQPICNYLIRSIQFKSSFDAPDFLIVAQALDGYFKRFVNKKRGKDHRKFIDQIDILLREFMNVELVNKSKLDSTVLEHSRHKYSHLIPDDDEKIAKAVDGEELYWLTQKCIVLLTCCILDMLGLTKDEINLCCNNSPVQQIVESFPLWLD